MKILIMTPLDERCVFAAMGLFKRLDKELQDTTLDLVNFTNYLYATKKCSWEHAAGTALSKDIPTGNYNIIIGNTKKYKEFDLIFNLFDGETEVEYKDYVLEKLEKVLNKKFDLHTADESRFCLKNLDAAAELINSLYTKGVWREAKLEELKKEYEEKLILAGVGPISSASGESRSS